MSNIKLKKKKYSLIKRLRQHAFLSQKELAEMCQAGQSTVSFWEAKKAKPFPRNVARLLEVAKRYEFHLTERMIKLEFRDVVNKE